MKREIRLLALFLPSVVLASGIVYGCKKEEESTPVVEKKPDPPPPPASTPVEIVADPPDAGDDAADADADADADAKPTGVNPVAACCAALQGYMANAPPEQKLLYGAAVAACNAARSNPNAGAALAQVRAALSGAGVPASCR